MTFEEIVAQMKEADAQVQRAFANLSPAVVREMIKKGINPLDMDITELNRTAEEIKNSLDLHSHFGRPFPKQPQFLCNFGNVQNHGRCYVELGCQQSYRLVDGRTQI